jgi:hypothetical protein
MDFLTMGSCGMRFMSVIAFVMAALGSMGAFAQTMSGAPAPEGVSSNQRAAYKAACERDARMIYRNGRNISDEWRQQVKATRKAYVEDCLAKSGFTQ